MRTMVPVSLWLWQGHHVDPHGHMHMGLGNLWGYVFLKGAWHPKWIETTILVRYCATCAFWVNIHQHCQQLYQKNNSLSAKSAETDLLAIAKLPAQNWKKQIEWYVFSFCFMLCWYMFTWMNVDWMDAPSTSPIFMTLSCFRQAGVHDDEIMSVAGCFFLCERWQKPWLFSVYRGLYCPVIWGL